MVTLYPAFSQPYKHFQRDLASLNGSFVVADGVDPTKTADNEIKIRFELSGTAVEGVDYDIITDFGNWDIAAPDTSHILTFPAAASSATLWIRVNDPTLASGPLSIVVDLVEVISGNGDLDESLRVKAVSFIEPSTEWFDPDDNFSYLGNVDGSGQGPRIGATNIGLFPNWAQGEVSLTLDIPVAAVQADDRTEQRITPYAHESLLINEGDFQEESLQHKGDMDLQMSVIYTATKDRNFDAYFKLAEAQLTGFCWVPFYCQPMYPYPEETYDPLNSDNSRVLHVEGLHTSVRRLLSMGRKIMRVNAADTSQFEVRKVLNTPEEIWDANTHGTIFVDSDFTLDIPNRTRNELIFTMLPMVMTGPLRRPSQSDAVHHFQVSWQMIDL